MSNNNNDGGYNGFSLLNPESAPLDAELYVADPEDEITEDTFSDMTEEELEELDRLMKEDYPNVAICKCGSFLKQNETVCFACKE